MKKLKILTKWAGGALVITLLCTSLAIAQENNPKLTDPEIASVAVTANQIDVDYGKIALDKSKDADIRKFAQTMINDHSGVINQAVALAKELGVTPKDNVLTQSLLDGAKGTKADLQSKNSKDFSKAYIDNEVAYHEAVIAAVKDILIPQTQNAQLKALLVKVAPVLEQHLAMAKKVQAEFKK